MTKNIKEIGKELLGKSLNSYHRRTGLTQLEKNNEMQGGILNGILSQVDDAYIEKTEQSNVIHLEGSGDGVVVLDSIEGNTVVNCLRPLISSSDFSSFGGTIEDGYLCFSATGNYKNFFLPKDKFIVKPSTTYTFIVDIKENTLVSSSSKYLIFGNSQEQALPTYWTKSHWVKMVQGETGRKIFTLTTKDSFDEVKLGDRGFMDMTCTSGNIKFKYMVLEGDWTNKEIPQHFEGLQSSFEENKEEGKYEIEILMKNKNLFDYDNLELGGTYDENGMINTTQKDRYRNKELIYIGNATQVTVSSEPKYCVITLHYYDKDKNYIGYKINANNPKTETLPNGTRYIGFVFRHQSSNGIAPTLPLEGKQITITLGNEIINDFIESKQNKIKLLINEPLRGIGNFKDRLLVKDNKLVIERNCNTYKFNSKDIVGYGAFDNTVRFGVYWGSKNDNRLNLDASYGSKCVCNILPYNNMWSKDEIGFYCDGWSSTGDDVLRQIVFRLDKTMVGDTLDSLKNWINNNELIVVYKTLNPIYEEVLNEYGEPILLEGYENGTLYIDSTIVPTTTVRYTPKMESFKTVREINECNEVLSDDISNNIISYMMEVDMMIMDKEMALMSVRNINKKNIRRIGEKDMTNMQKRTGEMLERLVKGKTLTEQECKTRVTTYLNANKITDEQAEELMLLISEVYA